MKIACHDYSEMEKKEANRHKRAIQMINDEHREKMIGIKKMETEFLKNMNLMRIKHQKEVDELVRIHENMIAGLKKQKKETAPNINVLGISSELKSLILDNGAHNSKLISELAQINADLEIIARK